MNNRNLLKILTLLLWGTFAGGFVLCKVKYGIDAGMLAREVHSFVLNTYYGPFLYILLYALRPLIFFPALFLTILSGALFGLWGGIFYTIIGENLSAMLAYLLGMFMGADLMNSTNMNFFSRWREKLRENSFMGVLLMRLVYLPFDLVNYGCGALGVRWKEYALATFIGIMPGLVTFVSIGASVQVNQLFSGFYDLTLTNIFDVNQVLVSVALFAGSLMLAKLVHYNHKQ